MSKGKRKAEGEPEVDENKAKEKKEKSVTKVCDGDATFEIVYGDKCFGVDIDTVRKWCNNPTFSKELTDVPRLTIEPKIFLGSLGSFELFLKALHHPFTFGREIFLNEAVHWFYAAEWFDAKELLEFAAEKIMSWDAKRVGREPSCGMFLAPMAARLASCSRTAPPCLRFRVYAAVIHMLAAIFGHLNDVQGDGTKKKGVDDKLDDQLAENTPDVLGLDKQAMWDILRCMGALGSETSRSRVLDLLCAV